MPYSVNRFDGELLVTINDGTIDTAATSLRLLGKGATNYGELSAENYVHMLENFYRNLEPPNPVIGQLWYHRDANGTGNHKLKINRDNDPESPDWVVLNGVAINLPGVERGINPTTPGFDVGPSDPQGGEMHWDGDQLRVYNAIEDDWPLLGPLSPPFANTVVEWERVNNGVGEIQELIKLVVNETIVAIFSDADVPFPPTDLGGGAPAIDPRITSDFPLISGGLNVNSQFISATPFVPLNASSEPTGDNLFDIGSAAKRWKDVHTVTINASQINTGNLSPVSDWFGDIAIELILRKDINLIPLVGDNQDIGSPTIQWKEIYVNSIHAEDLDVGGFQIPIENFARRDIDILPTVTLANDLGSIASVWKDAYIQEIHIDNIFLGTGSPSAVNVLNLARRDDSNAPTSDNSFDLGTTIRRWKELFVVAGNFDNVTSTSLNGILVDEFSQLDRVEAITKQHYFDAATLTAPGGVVDWNLDQAQVATLTLTTSTTINNPIPTRIKPGATYKLIIKQDASGGRVVSFGTTFKWVNSISPIVTTASNAVDVFTFVSDGTSLYGTVEQNFG